MTYLRQPADSYKLSPPGHPAAYVGYDSTRIARIFDGRHIISCRDVIFHESEMYMQTLQKKAPGLNNSTALAVNVPDAPPWLPPPNNQPNSTPILQPKLPPFPTCHKDAVSRPDASKWQAAMEKELRQQADKECWRLVPRPAGARVLSGKWVYKMKDDGTAKARWVVRGNESDPDQWEDTRATVVRCQTSRLLMSLAAYYGWAIHTADVTTAFLNGVVLNDVYMQQPTGFGTKAQNGVKMVCKLQKALYGLPVSAFAWYNALKTLLLRLGFRVSPFDECLFISAGGKCYITTHVDDFAFYGHEPEIAAVKAEIHKIYALVDAGPISRYLGMSVRRSPGCVSLNQGPYIADILTEFERDIKKGRISVPMTSVPPIDAAAPEHRATEYRRLIGKLNYLCIQTRPDLQWAVSTLGRFNTRPTVHAWAAMKHCLGYLQTTRDHSLHLRPDRTCPPRLRVYADASYATGKDSKSVSGRLITMNGAAVAWQSRVQTTTATSTAHAELIAAYEAALLQLPIQDILTDIATGPQPKPAPATAPSLNAPKRPAQCFMPSPTRRLQPPQPPRLLLDNEAAIAMASANVLTNSNRHFLVKYHYLHELISENRLRIEFVSTHDQLADGLTKPLPDVLHAAFLTDIGLHHGPAGSPGSDAPARTAESAPPAC